jgi:type II secretory pathway component PulF
MVPMIRALAIEYPGDYCYTLGKLSRRIEQGMPWVAALEQSPGALPEDIVLALRLGYENDTLLPMLEQLRRDESHDWMNREQSFWRNYLTYGLSLAVVMIYVLASFAYFIMPTLVKMMQEFELPGNQITVMRIATQVAVYLALFVLAITLVLIVFTWSERLRSLVRRLLWIPDASAQKMRGFLLRMFAHVTEHGSSMKGALATLAEHHTNWDLKRRLSAARIGIEQGSEPLAALQSAGLITPAQGTCLQGEPATTQAWIMRQLGSAMIGQDFYRWRWIQSLFPPLLILTMAFGVLWISSAMFDSLYSLVTELAHQTPGR